MPNFGLSVGLIHQNDYTKWRITLSGPLDSEYARGFYKINIMFPNNYPNSPPIFYFLNPIYHLNINPFSNQSDPLGYVPIDKLNLWQPGYTIRETITNLYALFYYAEPNFGYGNDRINEYKDFELEDIMSSSDSESASNDEIYKMNVEKVKEIYENYNIYNEIFEEFEEDTVLFSSYYNYIIIFD